MKPRNPARNLSNDRCCDLVSVRDFDSDDVLRHSISAHIFLFSTFLQLSTSSIFFSLLKPTDQFNSFPFLFTDSISFAQIAKDLIEQHLCRPAGHSRSCPAFSFGDFLLLTNISCNESIGVGISEAEFLSRTGRKNRIRHWPLLKNHSQSPLPRGENHSQSPLVSVTNPPAKSTTKSASVSMNLKHVADTCRTI